MVSQIGLEAVNSLLSLLTATDVQHRLARFLRDRRREHRLSRRVLAERSTVPASTIKRFETTGQVSLRQFLLLWQCLDDLGRVAALGDAPEVAPRTIEEVLRE
ncbi:MAG: helix-turn-helix domain-containing protein [Gammaproteobacteria bacterium]|nr:helix-turn-helix domain-containing protein [Gammaproteobacteria bacterium]MYE83437.1 helix-turn-helix domain-containing protein [Gammaproteobacteria bacterium]